MITILSLFLFCNLENFWTKVIGQSNKFYRVSEFNVILLEWNFSNQ